MVLTLILWALAAVGALRDWRRGRLDIRVVLLVASPLMLFPAQAYGGEMLIRVSLFALPFVALQACSVLLPDDGTRPSSRAAAGLVLTCFLLAVLIVTGRRFRHRRAVVRHARPGPGRPELRQHP